MTEWVTSSQIVNKQYYKQVVEKLCEHVGKKGPELCKNVWNLQQDNVAAHNVLTVNQFMATKKITALNKSSYSSRQVTPNSLLNRQV